MSGPVESAREAFAAQSWWDAHALLAAAPSLDAEDLERLAIAAHLLGLDDESARAWERAHTAWVGRGDVDRAARCVFWLSLALMLRGETATAAGWFARAERLLDAAGQDGAARGFLLLPAFHEALGRGQGATANAIGTKMIAIAQRFGDEDLLAFGLLGSGQAALGSGDLQRGMKLLDEAMVSVSAGGVSPVTSGIVYCAVIEACMDVCDVRRAAEWTAALDDWCAAQPELVPYRGQCLVHRSQVLQARGAWPEAADEAERARRRLSEPAHPALGLALYQQGELHRLRGELDDADHAYRAASALGREPAPGLALLRVAQGEVEAAAVTIRRMLQEGRAHLDRPVVLAAAVDVLLTAGDVAAARAAADELGGIARSFGLPLLRAMSDHADASVLLAEGDASSALAASRRAFAAWRDLELPYDAARARTKVGLACRALGDDDAAALELDTARATFEQLGAAPDVARLDELTRTRRGPTAAGLTERECEVLRLVAAGKTNREVAAELVISEHTVGRHLQNIFMKLKLSSRSAATAYAYEHHLV